MNARENAGRAAYEADRLGCPVYHDGKPRPHWEALPDYARESWCRNPTQRKTPLELEIQHRWHALGARPRTVKELDSALRAIGYRLDRSMDCRSMARIMTGERAGFSYPCISTGINEAGTGLRFCNVDARRDANFERLQAMRVSGEFFAVVRGAILEI